MNQKIIIESLAMDLKRIALGLHRGSFTMAKKFKEEALERQKELKKQEINDYLRRLLEKSTQALNNEGDKTAEDALMYSTLFQNFVLKRMGG